MLCYFISKQNIKQKIENKKKRKQSLPCAHRRRPTYLGLAQPTPKRCLLPPRGSKQLAGAGSAATTPRRRPRLLGLPLPLSCVSRRHNPLPHPLPRSGPLPLSPLVVPVRPEARRRPPQRAAVAIEPLRHRLDVQLEARRRLRLLAHPIEFLELWSRRLRRRVAAGRRGDRAPIRRSQAPSSSAVFTNRFVVSP